MSNVILSEIDFIFYRELSLYTIAVGHVHLVRYVVRWAGWHRRLLCLVHLILSVLSPNRITTAVFQLIFQGHG